MTALVYGENLLICKGHASSISDTLFDHAWSVMLILAQSVPHRGVAGSLVISGVPNYLIFQANKAYPDRSR